MLPSKVRGVSQKDKTAYIKAEKFKFKPISYLVGTFKYNFLKKFRITKDFNLNLL